MRQELDEDKRGKKLWNNFINTVVQSAKARDDNKLSNKFEPKSTGVDFTNVLGATFTRRFQKAQKDLQLDCLKKL